MPPKLDKSGLSASLAVDTGQEPTIDDNENDVDDDEIEALASSDVRYRNAADITCR
jgi:hypothetical protein